MNQIGSGMFIINESNHYKVLSNGYVTVCDTSSLAFDLLVWSPVTQGQGFALSSNAITSYLHFFHYTPSLKMVGSEEVELRDRRLRP